MGAHLQASLSLSSPLLLIQFDWYPSPSCMAQLPRFARIIIIIIIIIIIVIIIIRKQRKLLWNAESNIVCYNSLNLNFSLNYNLYWWVSNDCRWPRRILTTLKKLMIA